MTDLTITQARHHELYDVLAILDDVAQWLHHHGVRQWPARFTPDDFRARSLQTRIDLGAVYLAWVPGDPAPVATIGVDGEADPDFWGDDEPACYVHRMAVRRAYSGRGIGTVLLEWAAHRADQAGARWLRLDCSKHNSALQGYYRAQGFAQLDTIQVAHRGTGARFQRYVAHRGNVATWQVQDLTADNIKAGRPRMDIPERLRTLSSELTQKNVFGSKVLTDEDGTRLMVPFSASYAETVVIIDGAYTWSWYLDRWHPADDPSGAARAIAYDYLHGDDHPLPERDAG